MKFRTTKQFYFLLALYFSIVSCESDYSKLVKKELASGIKNDSLFFGMKFNNTKQDFFDICKDLNTKKIISEGPQNKFAKYTIKPTDEKESSIQMLFYGIFNKENTMTGMNMRFSYDAWSPWDKKHFSDQLIPFLKDTLEKWFPGNKFINVDLKKLKKEVFIKIDGNRQIKMYTLNAEDVIVKIEDLDKKDEYTDGRK